MSEVSSLKNVIYLQTVYSLNNAFYSFRCMHFQVKKIKELKWMSDETLQRAEKRKVKGKGERERYMQLNAEFQRIAIRDKKDFLRDQCKEIQENNRMGKTRDLFNKIRDTQGTFHAKWAQ